MKTPFQSKTLPAQLNALSRLAAEIQHAPEDRTAPPIAGRFSEPNQQSAGSVLEWEDISRRLEAWLASHDATGWLLTPDELVLVDGQTCWNSQALVLGAELHRPGDDCSLNLHHTPRGWIWEELRLEPENPAADAFVEEMECLAISRADDHPGLTPKRKARYEIEWRLTPSPDDVPATFRPVRSRFIGWAEM